MVLLALVYGGSKLYLQQKVKADLDRVIATAAPFMELSYGDIDSDLLNGTLTVANVWVAPEALTEGIRIDRIVIRGDGMGFLLKLAAESFGSEPPRRLQLAFQGMAIPLELMDNAKIDSALLRSRVDAPKACSLGGILQHAGLEDLGFQQLLMDGFVRYQLTPSGSGVTLEMAYTLQGIEYSRIEVDITGKLSPAAMASGAKPALNSLRLHYQLDSEFSSNMIAHCASKAGQKPQAFLDALFLVDNEVYGSELGFVPGPGLKELLKKVVGSAEELVITASPSPNLTMANISLYKPKQLLELLDLKVMSNGQPVTDLSYQFSPKSKEMLARLGKAQEPGSNKTAKVKRKRVVKRYLPVEVKLLKGYVGSELKIYSNQTEKPREGVLTSIGDRVVTVEQRLFGGKIELHIPLKKIERVEVLSIVKVD